MITLKDIAPENQPKKCYQLLIDGQWTDSVSHKTNQSYNPATGELLTEYQEGSAEDVDLAVAAAQKPLSAGSTVRQLNVKIFCLKLQISSNKNNNVLPY